MKRILILGSSRFVGGHLTKYLMDLGYQIREVDIKPIIFECFTLNKFIKGDLRVMNFVKSIFNKNNGFDKVYQFWCT